MHSTEVGVKQARNWSPVLTKPAGGRLEEKQAAKHTLIVFMTSTDPLKPLQSLSNSHSHTSDPLPYRTELTIAAECFH